MLATSALLALLCNRVLGLNYAALSPPVELRGIWLNADAIPRTEKAIRELVRCYHRANLNVIFPEVVARGYAVFPSSLLARDPRFEGAIDPLPPMIDEAHKLGMEVHPWVWVFRAGYTKDKGAILTAHPDWIELGKNGEELSPNGGLWISPAVLPARHFLICLYSELVRNYDVDGIHLDYIRYEVDTPTPYGYNPVARADFERKYGVDPINIDPLSSTQVSWIRYRERLVNTFVQSVALQLRSVKPELKISAAVGADPINARLNLMQNWTNWAENQWVDFVTPMTYTASTERFQDLVAKEKECLGSRTILAPGIGLHMHKEDTSLILEQVAASREMMADGQMLFASAHYSHRQAEALLQGPYSLPACVPYRNPQSKSALLANLAELLRSRGENEEANYYAKRATDLAAYASFIATPRPYVAPSPPPLVLPDSVMELPSIRIHRAKGDIIVDGALDDAGWANAVQVSLDYTNLGASSPVSTNALLAYDNTNLYIGFEAVEPNVEAVKAKITKRDGPVFYDDSVEVFIDPTAVRRSYFHLSTNTLGIRFDQRVLDTSWNADWSSAAKLGKGGWTIELAIPFATLGTEPPKEGSRWAINLARNRWVTGKAEYLVWSVPYGSLHSPGRFGIVTFSIES